MSEVGEVLPHLSISKPKQLRKLAGADRGPTRPHKMLQLSQIQTQPAHNDARDFVRRQRRLLLVGVQIRPSECESNTPAARQSHSKRSIKKQQVASADGSNGENSVFPTEKRVYSAPPAQLPVVPHLHTLMNLPLNRAASSALTACTLTTASTTSSSVSRRVPSRCGSCTSVTTLLAPSPRNS